MAAVAAKYDQFKKLGVEFLAISVDSRFVHKIWQEEELSKMVDGGVPFPMLSDAGGRIGTVYGVWYGNAFDQAQKAGTLATQNEHDDVLNFRKLLHGRVAVVPKNLDSGLSLLQTAFTPAEREQITYHPLALDSGPLVLMFSRKVERNARMVEAFNRGLKKLKEDGRYDRYFEESRRGDYVLKGE